MGGFVRKVTGQTAAKSAARDAARQQLEISQSAEGRASTFLQDQFDPSMAALSGGFNLAGDILSGAQTGIEEGFSPFFDVGQQAAQREAALSGALGNDAQMQAMQSFNESPGQSYLREMGEKAALRGAASQGRSLGGGVLAELQRRGTGLAQQDFGNQLARLSSIAARGQQAGQGLAGARSGLASNLANLQTGQTGQELALRSALGSGLANITTGQAANQSQIVGNRATNMGNAALAGGQMTMGLVGQALGAGAKALSGGA